MLTGLRFLLTYTCHSECDHCFIYSNPRASGTLTSDQIREPLDEATKNWRKNYMNASLNEIIVELTSSREFDDGDFVILSSYILNNHGDLKLDISKSVESLLPNINKR
jgi:hypothetical protein